MKRISCVALASATILFGSGVVGAGGTDADGQLQGVSVVALWQAASPVNTEFLTSEPAFVRQGNLYVGKASLNAMRADTKELIGVDITWTISLIDDNGAELRKTFSVPADAQYAVTAHYDYARAKTGVDTYSVVAVRSGDLIPQHLGYKQSDGTILPANDDLARSVFHALGISGPFMNRIILHE
jgi:hypothetical protein